MLKDYLLYKMFHHKLASNGQFQYDIQNIIQILFLYNSLEYIQSLNDPIIMFYHSYSLQLKNTLYTKVCWQVG